MHRLQDKRIERSPEQWLELLKAYVTEHGKLPKHCEKYQGANLGGWCNEQRGKYRQGKMNSGWQQMMEEVPGWWWKVGGGAGGGGGEGVVGGVKRVGMRGLARIGGVSGWSVTLRYKGGE